MEEGRKTNFSQMTVVPPLPFSLHPQNGYSHKLPPLGGNKPTGAKKLTIKNLKAAPSLPPDFQVVISFCHQI
jgi:hypothetical protein